MNRRDDKERYTKAREKYYPDEIPGYEEVGNTAYITFDEFYFADVDYYSGEKPEDHPEDTVGLMIHAYNEITREGSHIENVVLDLSNNGGGMADAAAYVIGMFLGDGSICMMNPLSGALVSQNFKIDANLDRKFYSDVAVGNGSDRVWVECKLNKYANFGGPSFKYRDGAWSCTTGDDGFMTGYMTELVQEHTKEF
ncbi:periplasmic protease, partial [Lachnospiraceae bacterium JC7]